MRSNDFSLEALGMKVACILAWLGYCKVEYSSSKDSSFNFILKKSCKSFQRLRRACKSQFKTLTADESKSRRLVRSSSSDHMLDDALEGWQG